MEKPLLRVSREVAACSQCRSAKIKCDGQLPVCGACKKTGKDKDCIAPGGDFAKGAERTYVNFLESRIDRMEKELVERRRHQRSAVVIQPAARKLDTAQKHEAGNVNNFVSAFGLLSVNATSRDFNGFNKEMSFARLIMSSCCHGQYPIESNYALPPKDNTIALLRNCLTTWLSIYPVLTETDIMASMERVYGRNQVSPYDQWNLRFVLAIIQLSRSNAKGDSCSIEAFHLATSALRYAEDVLQPGSIPSIQSIVILILYALLNPSHFSAWYLMGIATRLCVDIGLHQDPSDDLTTYHPIHELRRRVFHCVYALERVITISQIRAFSILDEAYDVELPTANIPPYKAFEEQEALAQLNNGQNRTHHLSTPSLDLLKMRIVESSWYQSYFGAALPVKVQPWYERYSGLTEMRNTFAQISTSTPEALKLMLVCEMTYNTILLITPPGQERKADQYGKAIVFDAAVDFANTLRGRLSKHDAMCTSLEIPQALFIGSRLLDILKDRSGYPYITESPKIPPAAPNTLLPPIRRRDMISNLEEGNGALRALIEDLDILGARFGNYPGNFTQDAIETVQEVENFLIGQGQRPAHTFPPTTTTTMAEPAQSFPPAALASNAYINSAGQLIQPPVLVREQQARRNIWPATTMAPQ